MSEAPDRPLPTANPRPGILMTLGICNIVFSVLSFLCILSSGLWYFAMLGAVPTPAPASTPSQVQVQVQVGPTKPTNAPPGVPMVGAFNPMTMGLTDPGMVRFSLVENGTSLLINGLMFVTGIGLINRKRWGARWWWNLAWARIILVFLLWGYYIIAVAPGFSEAMAKGVLAMFTQQGMPANRVPPVAQLTRIYSIMNLIVALGAIVVTSIYPAISLWLLSRPGVKAAIVDQPVLEAELP